MGRALVASCNRLLAGAIATGTAGHAARANRVALGDRRPHHRGHAGSRWARKRIEEALGWARTVAGLRKARRRGPAKIGRQSTLALAA